MPRAVDTRAAVGDSASAAATVGGRVAGFGPSAGEVAAGALVD